MVFFNVFVQYSLLFSIIKTAVDPLLETKTAKTIATGIHTMQKDLSKNASPQYLEVQSHDQRLKSRQESLHVKRQTVTLANEEAGAAVVVTQESEFNKNWRAFKENNPVLAVLSSISKKVEELDNPVIEKARDMWYGISKFFDETEEAKCVSAFRMFDPTFSKDELLKEATEFIIPEILEAHLKGDLKTLKTWCSEKVSIGNTIMSFKTNMPHGNISAIC